MMISQETNKSLSWGSCFYDHFVRYLGEPINRTVFKQDENSPKPWMQIAEYNEVFNGCKAYCTFGLSNYSSKIDEVAEVFMPIDDGCDEIPSILVATLSHLIRHKLPIGRGQVVDFAQIFSDFVTTFDKSAIYFSDPFGISKGFEEVKCGDEIGQIFLGCFNFIS